MLRKLEIALVVARHSKKRAGAVVHQHEVRDVHGQAPLAVERVDHLERSAKALLLHGFDLGRAGAPGLALGNELRRP